MYVNNLPVHKTSFVGRQGELAEISERIRTRSCRLLTLVGPGGIGKSRCAFEIARRTIAHYPNGAGFVDLTPLRQPDEIVLALSAALDISFQGGSDPFEHIRNRLQDCEMLLVFDNFEHLLGGVPILARLLDECGKITALVTSREVLRLKREWVWDVEGLRYPNVDHCNDANAFDAIRLFAERANQVDSRFDLASECACVVEIARAVEGMPLGIELAASWVRVLRCEEILREIARGLDILRSRDRDALPRQQSISAVLNHSYDLLSQSEQQVLRRLSVFRGNFSRQAASTIAGAELPQISALVDKSLVRKEEGGGYNLHALVRQFAKERLGRDQVEAGMIRDRHAVYYADFLAERQPHLAGAHYEDYVIVGREVDNLRAAWAWALGRSHIDVLSKLCQPLGNFHSHRGWHNEFWQLIAPAIDVVRQSGNDWALCRILTDYSEAARLKRLYEDAEAVLQEALSIARRISSRHNEAEALRCLGHIYILKGRDAASRTVLGECLAVGRDIGASVIVAEALFMLAFDGMRTGDYGQWDSCASEALELFRQADIRWGVCATLWQIAMACFLVHHDYECAQQMLDEAFRVYHDQMTPTPWLLSRLNSIAGFFASVEQRNHDARQFALKILTLARETPSEIGNDSARDAALITARVMTDEGEVRRAAELLSFGTAPPWDYHRQLLIEPVIERLRDALGSDEFEVAWQHGAGLDTESVITDMVRWLEKGTPPDSPEAAASVSASALSAALIDPLTPRELEVLRLIARGETNQEIATTLVIAYSTVKKHVNRIFSKLNASHRAEAVARAGKLGLIE